MDFENELNSSQYEAVTAKDNRLLFLAGAGTGKTHTMMYRTAYLVNQGVSPSNILLLTFTNKAAHEMVSRLQKLEIGGITACTFHSFCAKQLRLYGYAIDLNTKFTILTQSDATEIMKMFRPKEMKVGPTDLATIESFSINRNISIEEACLILNAIDSPIEIERIIEQAQIYRHDHDMLTYDDLLTEFIYLLQKSKYVREKIRSRYKYIMVDEYQDTNTLQDKIIELINPENLAVVGDDCQSLYGFRGADIKNILGFPDRYKSRTIKIQENYRSNQDILNLSNAMMQRHCHEGFPKWLNANTDSGNPPILHRPIDVNDEADYVFELIIYWLKQGIPPSEICVLSRTARATYTLEHRLNAAHIQYDKRGGPKFIESSHVQNVMSLFELTRNRANRIAWFRSLMILKNIGQVNAKKIADSATENIDNLLDDKYKKKTFYQDLVKLYEIISMKDEWHKVLSSIIEYYLDTTLKNIQNSSSKKKDELIKHLLHTETPDLELLKQIADAYENEDDFLDSLLTSNVPTLEKTEDEKIVVSTIHSAKGLEFECVVVVGLAETIFPREQTDEELRCLYVALTRAKHNLVLSCPKYYMGKTGWESVDVPLFLQGLIIET